MEKYLVTLEFRYKEVPQYEEACTYANKEITIGVYDTFEEACKEGNKTLIFLESKFKLNPNYNKKERFSLNGGCFGSKKDLISNLGYLQTPFDFYAKITTLKYEDVEQSVEDVLDSLEKYKEYENNN